MIEAASHVWKSIAELMRLVHAAHTQAAVAACETDIARGRANLEKAIAARDAALAAIRIHDHAANEPAPIPTFLLCESEKCPK